MKKTFLSVIKWLLFIIYSLVMLDLLFLNGRFGSVWSGPIKMDNYWSVVLHRINLKPFKTINGFIKVLMSGRTDVYARIAIDNLLGNIILFIPLGFFLPWLFKKCRKGWVTLLWTVIIIFCVETAQSLLLAGSGDVDDLILNTVGSLMGYFVFVLLNRKFVLAKGNAN